MFLLGAGVKAYSSIKQGRIAEDEAKAQAAIAERNARILEQDAIAREQKARFDQLRQATGGAKVLGRLRAGLGASGARLDVGAPIRLLSDQAEELELDMLLIGFEGATDASRLRSQARGLRLGAEFSRERGENARKTSLLRTFTGAVSDYGTYRTNFPSAPGEDTGAGTTLKVKSTKKPAKKNVTKPKVGTLGVSNPRP